MGDEKYCNDTTNIRNYLIPFQSWGGIECKVNYNNGKNIMKIMVVQFIMLPHFRRIE
jgi:hypothetical protein